jgi:integrase
VPKLDTRYLQKGKEGYWQFVKRIPNTTETMRRSLKTKSLTEAQARRDMLLKEQHRILEKASASRDALAMLKQYEAATDEDKEFLRDEIQEQAEDIAIELGVQEALHFKPENELTEEEKKPVEYYKAATGQLHILKHWLPLWLGSMPHQKQKRNYQRAANVLLQQFKFAEDVNWEKADNFLNRIGAKEGVRKQTVKKWLSSYVSFWKFMGFKPPQRAVWKDHDDIPGSSKVEKEPWTPEEVVLLHDTLRKRNDRTSVWLADAVWIAAHTGARADAIAKLQYDAEKQTILFPALKKETHHRVIPAHPEIRTNLTAWMINKKATTTISVRFSEFKTELGYGNQKDFHSFRRTFTTEMENLLVPENICADIVGHKKKTMSYGIYSGGSRLETMRTHLFKLDYRAAIQTVN